MGLSSWKGRRADELGGWLTVAVNGAMGARLLSVAFDLLSSTLIACSCHSSSFLQGHGRYPRGGGCGMICSASLDRLSSGLDCPLGITHIRIVLIVSVRRSSWAFRWVQRMRHHSEAEDEASAMKTERNDGRMGVQHNTRSRS